MSNTTAVEGMHFLTQSPVRVQILELLYENGDLQKRSLMDQINASRVTVRRNIIALEERDLITITGRTCVITILGEVVVEDVLPALGSTDAVERLRPFMRWFPEDELGFDVRTLADATVVVSDTSNPYAPVNRHLEIMRSANQFRCLLPAVGLQPMTVARDRVIEEDQEQEVVFGANVASTLREEKEYAEVIGELVESENCELFVTSSELTYYLGLCEECVQIGVEDDDGMPRALVETTADEVREWADQTYNQYLVQTERFTL